MQTVKFGKFDIPRDHVFSATQLSFAFVNLKPLAEGVEHQLHTYASACRPELEAKWRHGTGLFEIVRVLIKSIHIGHMDVLASHGPSA